jgi:hypothetical protein
MAGILFTGLVSEVSRVPDHNVLVVDQLPVAKLVKVGLGIASGPVVPVVELGASVPEDPHISAGIGVSDPIP